MPQNEIKFGALVKQKLEEHGRSASWLAKKIHCSRTNIYKIFEKDTVHAALMKQIGKALDTDFFAYYSENQNNNEKTDKG